MTHNGNTKRILIFCCTIVGTAAMLIAIGCDQNSQFVGIAAPGHLTTRWVQQDDQDALDPSESGTAED